MAKTTERRKYPTVLRYPGGKSRIIYYLFRKNMAFLRTSRNTVRVSLVVGLVLLQFSVMYPDVPVWVNDLYYNLFISGHNFKRI